MFLSLVVHSKHWNYFVARLHEDYVAFEIFNFASHFIDVERLPYILKKKQKGIYFMNVKKCAYNVHNVNMG